MPIDLTDTVFGHWRVLRAGPFQHYRRRGTTRSTRLPRWRVRCACGTERDIRQSVLVCGRSRSCGCASKEARRAAASAANLRHGHARHRHRPSPEYLSWNHMRQRCMNPRNARFKAYGGRGITVTPEWNDFAVFLRDMGPRQPGTSLDRYPDTNGPYTPGNCRWATPLQQQANLRRTVVLTHQGETRPLVDWARRLGIDQSTLRSRLTRGWSLGAALRRVGEQAATPSQRPETG